MTSKISFSALLLLLGADIAGCASIQIEHARKAAEPPLDPPEYYVGTKADIGLFTDPEDLISPWVGLVDFPLSLTYDTLCLPKTFFDRRQDRIWRQSIEESELNLRKRRLAARDTSETLQVAIPIPSSAVLSTP